MRTSSNNPAMGKQYMQFDNIWIVWNNVKSEWIKSMTFQSMTNIDLQSLGSSVHVLLLEIHVEYHWFLICRETVLWMFASAATIATYL